METYDKYVLRSVWKHKLVMCICLMCFQLKAQCFSSVSDYYTNTQNIQHTERFDLIDSVLRS